MRTGDDSRLEEGEVRRSGWRKEPHLMPMEICTFASACPAGAGGRRLGSFESPSSQQTEVIRANVLD